MAVTIDKKLNLVIPIERGTVTRRVPLPLVEGQPQEYRDEEVPDVVGYVYSLPFNLPFFESNSEVIARTYTKIYAGGLGAISAPRVAAFTLKRVAEEMGDPPRAVAIMDEIRRLSMYATGGSGGWKQVTLVEAIRDKLMTEEEISEVENAITFFTVNCAMDRKGIRSMLFGMAAFWGALPTPSTFTEFLASSTTSTETVTSPPKVGSSVPR